MWEKLLLVFLKEEFFCIKIMYLKQKKKNQKKKEKKIHQVYWQWIKEYKLWFVYTKHFNSNVPSALIKQLYETKNRKKNNAMVNLIKSGIKRLKGRN